MKLSLVNGIFYVHEGPHWREQRWPHVQAAPEPQVEELEASLAQGAEAAIEADAEPGADEEPARAAAVAEAVTHQVPVQAEQPVEDMAEPPQKNLPRHFVVEFGTGRILQGGYLSSGRFQPCQRC